MDAPTPHLLAPRLQSALDLAFTLHGRDARKQSAVPVLAHLLGVCAIVQHDGGTEDESIAALLHDTLEDKADQISAFEIEERFGSRVLTIVTVATDTPPEFAGGVKPPWRMRKEAYLRNVRASNPGLLRVTIADKIDNLRATLADYHRLGERIWARFNAGKEDQLWYYHSALDTYRAAGYPHGPLLSELGRLINELDYVTGAWGNESRVAPRAQ
jgi:(p)ppGpp synthase/HD superfamily hydrolase